MSAPTCEGCSNSLKIGPVLWKYECAKCNKGFCKKCIYKGKPMFTGEFEDKSPQQVCEPCLMQLSPVDKSRTFDTYGPEDGRPMVLLHGATIGRQSMSRQAELMAEKGFRVYVPDLPRHNNQDEIALNESNLDRVLLDLFDGTIKQAALLVGHSLGGWVAIWFAHKHPDYVSGLVLNGCLLNFLGSKNSSFVMKTAQKGVYALTPTKRANFILSGMLKANISLEDIKKYLLSGGLFYECWGEMWAWITTFNFVSAVENAKVPIFFLLSDKDSYNDNEKEFTNAATDFKRLMLHGGSYLPWELPQRFSKEVNKWINQVFESGSSEEKENGSWAVVPPKNRAPVKEHTHDLSVVSGRVDLQQPQVGGYGKEQKVAVYRVKATLDGVERTVDRRFRDFSKLHDRIASLAKNHQDFPKLPSLPGKKIKLFTDHFSEEFIETRRSALEQYLMLMSQMHPSLWLDDFYFFLVGSDAEQDKDESPSDASSSNDYKEVEAPSNEQSNEYTDFGSSVDVIDH